MKKLIQVAQSSMPPFEEYMDEIKDLWDSKWLTNMGEKHQRLEKKLVDYLKVTHLKLYTNGHSGLEIAIRAMDLTGEVITTPYTFSSTTQAIIQNGLEPVFCDINEEDYTIDVTKIEDLITDQTSAIIPVHVYGNICDVEEIERIAKKHDLKVIYDAAHVFGVEYEGRGIGSYGDASMFSFHATKVFNTIEGGAVTYNDGRLSESLEAMKNFGQTSTESVQYVAGNAKMNEFQAAMGLTNLNYVDGYISGRKEVYDEYIKYLDGIKGIKLSKIQPGVKSNYAYFPVIFDGYKYNRDEVQSKLASKGIYARKYFYPLTSSFAAYEGKYRIEDTPVAKYISENVLTLPLYPDLSLEDVKRICNIILE